MKVKRLVVGELETNCYIIEKDNKCLIIDPGDEVERIIKEVANKQVEGILVTHHHFDHVGALEELEKYYHLKHNTHDNSFNYEIIKTPGHKEDSLTFYFHEDNIMFTGDFLFYHTIGRVDLEGGNREDMLKSLELIKHYPDNIVIYPGHGDKSILGEEKKFFTYYFF